MKRSMLCTRLTSMATFQRGHSSGLTNCCAMDTMRCWESRSNDHNSRLVFVFCSPTLLFCGKCIGHAKGRESPQEVRSWAARDYGARRTVPDGVQPGGVYKPRRSDRVSATQRQSGGNDLETLCRIGRGTDHA